MRPVILPPQLPSTFYRGFGRIADFRGDRDGSVPRDRPEDWIGSTVSRFGDPGSGLTVLPDGRLMRDAVDAAPGDWLGPGSKAAGVPASLTIPLVKYLDAGQRLPVHVHPDDAFARSRLGAPQGKTEAWLILQAPAGSRVHLGWRDEMPVWRLADLVRRQDVPAMLEAMNPVPVATGDVVLVPAGTAHAVGEGVFLVEVQQAADLSILLEWQAFLTDSGQAFGGADLDVALGCVDVAPLTSEVFDELVVRGALDRSAGQAVARLLPDAADGYFGAWLVRDGATLPAGYSTAVVIEGSGTLSGDGWATDVERGMSLAVPYAAGGVHVAGPVTLAAFTPPGRGWPA
ncbi:class I mannose-6-phosphate isomerase [Phytoactinopolyspora endophytica]|uniref:class I mannose-6-phosphate isomerase n=1 Tax=Phytoactinopolyspora endophytica TaxID=1642495 RepID=UPI00197B579D|nr:class I mannose-6-phosphate isomerase [Phytoactinopolyspora endophytica]